MAGCITSTVKERAANKYMHEKKKLKKINTCMVVFTSLSAFHSVHCTAQEMVLPTQLINALETSPEDVST